jgi:hypothetical protein
VEHGRPGAQVFAHLELGFDPLGAHAAKLDPEQLGKREGVDGHFRFPANQKKKSRVKALLAVLDVALGP